MGKATDYAIEAIRNTQDKAWAVQYCAKRWGVGTKTDRLHWKDAAWMIDAEYERLKAKSE